MYGETFQENRHSAPFVYRLFVESLDKFENYYNIIQYRIKNFSLISRAKENNKHELLINVRIMKRADINI